MKLDELAERGLTFREIQAEAPKGRRFDAIAVISAIIRHLKARYGAELTDDQKARFRMRVPFLDVRALWDMTR